MEDEEDEDLLELYKLDIKAASVASCRDFIEFLEMLNEGVLEDDEADERLQSDFFDNLRRKLNFYLSTPQLDHLIEVPEQPDWSWMARLFIIGAFEN